MQPIPSQSQQLTLILFTASYPYDAAAEQTFLGAEIKYLVKSFDKIILVPEICKGNKLFVPLGVEVDENYSTFLQNTIKLSLIPRILTSRDMHQDLLTRPSLLLHPSALINLFRFVGRAILTQRWVENWIEREENQNDRFIFYTYWFNQAALGIGKSKRRYPKIILVSRAHGYDLYEERNEYSYLPCRRTSIAFLDDLYPDSDAGTRYLTERYPDFASIFTTARLGVTDPGFVTSSSQDDVFRIVSCSMISPVKRVDLLLQGIFCAARMRPNQRFEWHHFGNGGNREILQGMADDTFPSNARAYLPGYSTKDNLLRFYRQNPIDVFVNVSKSEGTPVSIMEAISCGIPVIATAVGGNIEIVSEQNGLLLNHNPAPEEIASALLKIWDQRQLVEQKRRGSRQVWQERYNADTNFPAFIDRLKAIGHAG